VGGNLIDEVARLCAGPEDPAGDRLARLCRALRAGVPHYDWVGIYLLEEDGAVLVLRGWDGPAATEHVRIPVGQGICGLAAREAQTVIVDDVREDPRYLQCFPGTRAEIVVPILAGGRVLGEIDIDSDRIAVFNATDRMFLEWCAGRLASAISG
jgi:GAF domain-containing protein